MPELPEVETVKRGLAPVLDGARIAKVEARRPDLRFPLPDRFTQRLKGARILTVGEFGGFAELGGVINFISERNKVRFEINTDAARSTGLTISSELLKLAKLVKS